MKNNLFKMTTILLIGGILTKILSMIIRITLSRLLGDNIGIYMMILPTFSLLISLTSLGLPTAISKLVSEDTKNNKNLVFSIIPITLLFDILIIIIVILLSDFISLKLLHNIDYKYSIIAMSLVLPFIDISSIMRGYFFGKQKMIPHIVSNIIEDIVRFLLIIIGIPYFLNKSINITLIYIILINIVSELSSILTLLIFLPKNITLNKKDFKINYKNIYDTFKIGIPTTLSRLIGNVGYFLEPIILTNVLINNGYTNSFITHEYGIINGYVMPILLLPSFFTYAISSALLPIISKEYISGKNVYKRLNQAIFYSLVIGILFTTFIIIKPDMLLKILYNTSLGTSYIRFLSIFFLLHYIQAPLTTTLQAINLSNKAFLGTLLGTIFRIITIFILSHFKIGIYPIIIASIINILIVTIHHIVVIRKHL